MFGFYGFIKSNLSLPFTFDAYIVKAVQEIATIIRVNPYVNDALTRLWLVRRAWGCRTAGCSAASIRSE
jgi:hypothetical protein